MSNARSLASFLSSTPTADFNFDSNSLVVDISENTVGIGDTTPDGKLEVRQTASADILNLYDDTTNVLTVVDGGNVGIGDDSPDGKLEVRQSGTDDIFNLYDDTTNVLTVVDGGKVGIGTSTPDGLVDIRQSGTDDILNLYDGTDNIFTVVDGGKVGIKSATPDGMLDVRSLTSDDIFNLYDGSTNVFTVIDGGRVGIGTSSPGFQLDLQNAGSDGIRVAAYSTTAGNAARLYLAHSDNGTGGTQTAVDAEDILGQVIFQGSNGTAFVSGARIQGVADETFSGTAQGSYLSFFTVDNTTTTEDERMRIDHNGNVGINTTAPSDKLHIADTGSNACNIRIQNDTQYFLLGTVEESSNDKFIIHAGQSGANELILSSGGALFIRGALTENSDERLKTNVETISSALSKVEQMRGVSYERIDNDDNTVGVIAQELETIAPELVNTATDPTTIGDVTMENLKSVSYTHLTAYLIEAIKELSAKVTTLEDAGQ